MFYGVDVSNNQRNPDWEQVRRLAVFAHIKATEGATYVDPTFAVNKLKAESAGLHVGAYHFARPDHHPGTAGALLEARHFVAIAGKPKPGQLRHVLDLEEGFGALTAWAGTFLAEVERLTGVRPLLYTYPAFITSHLNLKTLAGYGLWLADYGRNDGVDHGSRIPNIEHQYTSNGRISGVLGRTDLNSAPSLEPIVVPSPPKPAPTEVAPVGEPKNQNPFTRKLWPVPIPQWFWAWAEWRLNGCKTLRPTDAPAFIPAWAWVRLAAL